MFNIAGRSSLHVATRLRVGLKHGVIASIKKVLEGDTTENLEIQEARGCQVVEAIFPWFC